jgi:glucose/arabinose dehydrogenase
MEGNNACATTLPGAWVAPNFCAYTIPCDISVARMVLSVGESNFLALERGTASVIFCHDTNGDSIADSRLVVSTADNLNHGLAIHNGYLYASSDSTVYRWRIMDGSNFLEAVGDEQVVIINMNEESDGSQDVGHRTRTMEFDDQGRMYVSVGSVDNIDSDSFRSRIRRFDISSTDNFPINFLDGEVFADGLRNEVGLAFDKFGVLWGVENSADNLFREDLGGDIVEDNPADELNRFKEADIGQNWGYPQCWTEFDVPEPFGMGKNTVWAWPSFQRDGTATDAECRANTIPPEMALQGHSAPLGITFYHWKSPNELPPNCPPQAAFPQSMDGYAFIAYHGKSMRELLFLRMLKFLTRYTIHSSLNYGNDRKLESRYPYWLQSSLCGNG